MREREREREKKREKGLWEERMNRKKDESDGDKE